MCEFFRDIFARCFGTCFPWCEEQESHSEDVQLEQLPVAQNSNDLPNDGAEAGPSSVAVPARSPLEKEEEITEVLRPKLQPPKVPSPGSRSVSEFNRHNFNRRGRRVRYPPPPGSSRTCTTL